MSFAYVRQLKVSSPGASALLPPVGKVSLLVPGLGFVCILLISKHIARRQLDVRVLLPVQRVTALVRIPRRIPFLPGEPAPRHLAPEHTG